MKKCSISLLMRKIKTMRYTCLAIKWLKLKKDCQWQILAQKKGTPPICWYNFLENDWPHLFRDTHTYPRAQSRHTRTTPVRTHHCQSRSVTDFHRLPPATGVEYTFFSHSHGILPKTANTEPQNTPYKI